METKLYHKRFKISVPEWLPNRVENWIAHGLKPGKFFRSILENDLAGVIGRSDHIGRETLFGIYKMLYNGIPGGIWGSKERVKNWLDADQEKRNRIYKLWVDSGDQECWTPDNFEKIAVGIPDTEMFGIWQRHQLLETAAAVLIKVMTPEQYEQVIKTALEGNEEASKAVFEIIRRKSMEVETDGD